MIPPGKTYSDLGWKLKRDYHPKKFKEQPPTPPQKYGPSPNLGNPIRWRRCEMCGSFYEARTRRYRRACDRIDCKRELHREWYKLNKAKTRWYTERYQHSLGPEGLAALRKKTVAKYTKRVKEDPEYREHRRKYMIQYFKDNKERIAQRHRCDPIFQAKNREKSSKYYWENRDKILARQRAKRKAKRKAREAKENDTGK